MLSGIKVLDLTNVLAGPFCCHQLAHMGAEVIKIETVGRGDLARQLGASKNLSSQLMGISFLAQNAGKKSLTINLKSQKGKEIFLKLVKVSDVVVENFRPGVMKRLGLEYDYLKIEHVSNGAGTPNPLLGVNDDEIFSEAEYDMGDRSLLPYDYADWIRPNGDAIGAFYTGAVNWWHIVDTEEDENRKASSPTHSMWIGDETKGNGEYLSLIHI
mgnify:CR=1 FL=1